MFVKVAGGFLALLVLALVMFLVHPAIVILLLLPALALGMAWWVVAGSN